MIVEVFPHLVEREVLVGWFAHLGGLSLLKYVQFFKPALRALGLLLADGTPTEGGGKTF